MGTICFSLLLLCSEAFYFQSWPTWAPYVFLFFSSAVRHSISRVGQHGLLGSNYYSVHCTVVSMPSHSGGGGKIEIRTGEDKPPALLFPRFSGWEKCNGRGGGLGSHHQLFGYSIRDCESYGDDVCVPEWKVQWQHPLHAGEECGFRSSKRNADCGRERTVSVVSRLRARPHPFVRSKNRQCSR